MFYIHDTSCISAQQAFSDPSVNAITLSIDNKLFALNGNYDSIPPNILRRLGKAVKMGIATGNTLLANQEVAGIVMGTANGGLEDCIKFLNQIMEFDEGRLTPTNFVQSTTNAIAGQLGIMSKNKGYNITHVHRGLAFENAVIDIEILLHDNPEQTYLLGGVDEISDYNYTIEDLAGAYKKESISNIHLLVSNTPGTLAGEGAAMFLVNNKKEGAQAVVRGVHTVHTNDIKTVNEQLLSFLKLHIPSNESVDLLLSGKNGDVRLADVYNTVENNFTTNTEVAYYKNLTGEFPTNTAVAMWIATEILNNKKTISVLDLQKINAVRNILLYNTYKGKQHSFILLSKI